MYAELTLVLTNVIPLEFWNPSTILYGSERYDSELSKLSNITALKFIIDSKRFA